MQPKSLSASKKILAVFLMAVFFALPVSKAFASDDNRDGKSEGRREEKMEREHKNKKYGADGSWKRKSDDKYREGKGRNDQDDLYRKRNQNMNNSGAQPAPKPATPQQ